MVAFQRNQSCYLSKYKNTSSIKLHYPTEIARLNVASIKGFYKMEVISFNQAKENLEQVLDRVIEDADYTVIHREDVGNVVVMSLDFFNSLMETVHLLKSPANVAHLEKSISQFKQGKVVEHNLLND